MAGYKCMNCGTVFPSIANLDPEEIGGTSNITTDYTDPDPPATETVQFDPNADCPVCGAGNSTIVPN